jgi:hypothetical protein
MIACHKRLPFLSSCGLARRKSESSVCLPALTVIKAGMVIESKKKTSLFRYSFICRDVWHFNEFL